MHDNGWMLRQSALNYTTVAWNSTVFGAVSISRKYIKIGIIANTLVTLTCRIEFQIQGCGRLWDNITYNKVVAIVDAEIISISATNPNLIVATNITRTVAKYDETVLQPALILNGSQIIIETANSELPAAAAVARVVWEGKQGQLSSRIP